MAQLKVEHEAQPLVPKEELQRFISQFHQIDAALREDHEEIRQIENRIKRNQERFKALSENIVKSAFDYKAEQEKLGKQVPPILTFKWGPALYSVDFTNQTLLINDYIDLENQS